MFRRRALTAPTAPNLEPSMRHKLQACLWGLGVKVALLPAERHPATLSYGVILGKITAAQVDKVLPEAAGRLGLAFVSGAWADGFYRLDIPRPDRQTVAFDDMPAELPGSLPVGLGVGRDGAVSLCLSKAVHTLVAGATGSGKSVFLHSVLCSLLRLSPSALRLVLVDPKLTELSIYKGVPHLLQPPITDMNKVEPALAELVKVMQQRYELFSGAGVRDIAGYNIKSPRAALPYIVLVCDEVADLFATHKKECEPLMLRLSQKARAAGVHMVLATQRPSQDSMSVSLRANLPTRVSFSVQSYHDSLAILGVAGAERLLSGGDGLLSGSSGRLERFQAAYISTEQVEGIIKDAKARYGDSTAPTQDTEPDMSPLAQAKTYVQNRRWVNATALRKAGIVGSNTAGHNLIKELREAGVCGEYDAQRKACPVLSLSPNNLTTTPQLPSTALELWDVEVILGDAPQTASVRSEGYGDRV